MKDQKELFDGLLEVGTIVTTLLLLVSAGYGIYGPVGSREASTIAAAFLLVVVIAFLAMKAIIQPLMARIGARNLVRHRGDSAIAVLGFMVGTSIICSSLAIGDTVDNFVESLIYENYHLVDEVIYSVEPSGNNSVFTGAEAQKVSDRIWGMKDRSRYIDGLSWEVEQIVSVINPDEDLIEPVMTIRAFSPGTVDAFGGLRSGGEPVGLPLGPGSVAITKDVAKKLNADEGSVLLISSGIDSMQFRVAHVLDDMGRALVQGRETLFISLYEMWELFQMPHSGSAQSVGPGDWSDGSYNVLFISNKGGRVEGGELCRAAIPRINEALEGYEYPPGSGRDLRIVQDKGSGVERAKEGISTFTKLFVTLGAFSIVAGISLIINIFVMLSEERREEMGISRAIGTRRKHLRTSYLFEGALYSVLSSIIGVVIGLISAYGVVFFLENLIASFTDQSVDILRYFTFRASSLVLSFVAGFSITLGTTWFISQRIANLNIVSAVKGLPPPKVHTAPQLFVERLKARCAVKGGSGSRCSLSRLLGLLMHRPVMWGILSSALGAISISWGVSSGRLWPSQLGLTSVILGAGLIALHWINPRLVLSAVSLLAILQWIFIPPFFRGLQAGLEVFLISGFVLVGAGVVLAVFNLETAVLALTALLRSAGTSMASVRMAVSYPLKKRFRAGATMFMFALIIFTVTGISVVAHLFDLNIEDLERSIGGGYEVIGISAVKEIPDLKGAVERNWGPGNLSRLDFDRSTSLSVGFIRLNVTGRTRDYIERTHLVCGVTPEFRKYNTYGFTDVDWGLLRSRGIDGRSDESVWRSVDQPDLVIVDSSLGENTFGPPGLGLKAGSGITLVLQNGTRIERTIAAITDQFAIRAVFTNESNARKDFNITYKRLHMFDVKEGEDVNEVSDGLRRSLKEYGLYTIVVKDIVKEILRFQNGFFNLFNAYLSLGLLIGIVGLGIVSLRSVYERRHEIGMMRAIGFKKRAIISVFVGESVFVSGSGILVGSVMGTLLAYVIWRDQLQGDLPLFGIPWSTVVLMALGALVFSLLSTVPPSRMASRIAPAEALRYE